MNEKMVWYRRSGDEGDVVISTRVRLARNLPRFPFPDFADDEQKKQIADLIRRSLQGESLREVDVADLPRREALSLAERHLVSPVFAEGGSGRALFLSEDESVSLMVNEEDHLRIQVMRAGLDLDGAFAEADALDSHLDEKLEFAFDEKLGYLTQCPTNLGTAMRASLMLHLPALQETRAIHQLAGTVSKLGLTIRGLYGEGSRAEGAMYQLSNQVTLGISEREAIENLKSIAMQIVRQERVAREQFCHEPAYEDRVWRALGVLKTARLLSHEECMEKLSDLRVGCACGLLPDVTLDTLSGLLCDVQPATLMTLAGKDMEPAERDVRRAELVRERL